MHNGRGTAGVRTAAIRSGAKAVTTLNRPKAFASNIVWTRAESASIAGASNTALILSRCRPKIDCEVEPYIAKHILAPALFYRISSLPPVSSLFSSFNAFILPLTVASRTKVSMPCSARFKCSSIREIAQLRIRAGP